ncbi:MAG: hypothetical protein Q9196_002566 [Gyalolechia fulgens]
MTSILDDELPLANVNEDPPSPKPYIDPQSWSEWDQDFPQSTINSYLTNSLSPEETALALTTPITNYLSFYAGATDDTRDPESVWSADTPDPEYIWSAMLATARQHPYDSPAIPALVALLGAIKAIPKPKQLRHEGLTYWTDLPHLGIEIRENWNRVIGEPDHSNRWTCTVEQWTSMNAFVAQLTVADVANYSLYCIWALRVALEDVPGQRSSVGDVTDLDHHVPAAAVWILVAGRVIYTEWLRWGVEESEITGVKGGTLWGMRGFGPKRWVFWKDRFGWVARQEEVEVKEETRRLAKMAAQRMEDIV